VEAGVDPNVALGFGRHEHSLRYLGVAATTKAWGNLRPGSSWTGEVYSRSKRRTYPSHQKARDDGASDLFRVYPTYHDGLADFLRLIRLYYFEGVGGSDRLRTVSAAVRKYAPSADGNDEQAYINAVNGDCDRQRNSYGEGQVDVIPAKFRARNISAEKVNIRSGPGLQYEDVGDVAAAAAVECNGYTTEGPTFEHGGAKSVVWLRLESGRGWITGHPAFTEFQRPPSIGDLQADLQKRTAERDAAEARYKALVAKARATRATRPQAATTVAALLELD